MRGPDRLYCERPQVNRARDDGGERLQSSSFYWKPAAQVRDQTGQEQCSDAVMTAATCKTQTEQTSVTH